MKLIDSCLSIDAFRVSSQRIKPIKTKKGKALRNAMMVTMEDEEQQNVSFPYSLPYSLFFPTRLDMTIDLPWLRTLVIAEDDRNNNRRRKRERQGALLCPPTVARAAVQSIVVNGPNFDPHRHFFQSLFFLGESSSPCSFPFLTSLDVRSSPVGTVNGFVATVAKSHAHRLRRLCVPPHSGLEQSTLNHFTKLEELDVSGNHFICHVDSCAASLRVLYAQACTMFSRNALRHATQLRILHAPSQLDVTPVASGLLELRGGSCVDDAVLAVCGRLQVLTIEFSSPASSLLPVAHSIRELWIPYFTMSRIYGMLSEVLNQKTMFPCLRVWKIGELPAKILS